MLWALVYLVYGALDELTQPLTGREADVADWVFDAIGVGLATLSLWLGFIPKWVHRSRTGN
jgi:VanZ family protein